MVTSIKNPLIYFLLILTVAIGSFFIWKYLDIRNQELQIKLDQDKSEQEKLKLNQELNEVKRYEDSVVRFNDTILKISTKWRDGKMDYKINLPVSEIFFKAISREDNWQAVLTIELIDKDGFKIDSIYMPVQNSVSIVDKDDRLIEKREMGSIKISSSSYLEIDGIRVLSNIN